MINSKDFSKRLEKIMDHYSESASSFSDKIGVQRSSISHILSGRNKPSLDFVMKVLNSFPDVELYWLLNGKGNFPSTSSEENKPVNTVSNPPDKIQINDSPESEIDRIVVFYKDGTFQDYKKR